jgi:GNAT superfamily N-acetyltransferase
MNALEAFQRNWIGFFEIMPSYYRTARSWQEDGIVIGITGLSISAFNAAVVLDESFLTSAHIPQLATPFEAAGVPFSIQLCSRTPLPTCDDLLKSYGYVELFTDPVMIREGPLLPVPANTAVDIHAVDSAEDRACYRDILMEGFNLPPTVGTDFFDMLLNLREGRQMIARMDGKPVGSGMLLYASGVAAVYNVATVPAARKQGIGAAMMYRLHNQALADGFPATVLASSEMGLALYQKLGYRQDGYQIGYALPERL